MFLFFSHSIIWWVSPDHLTNNPRQIWLSRQISEALINSPEMKNRNSKQSDVYVHVCIRDVPVRHWEDEFDKLKPPLCVASQHPATVKKAQINREVECNEEQMSLVNVCFKWKCCLQFSQRVCDCESESDSQCACYCNSIIVLMSYELRVAEGLTCALSLTSHSDSKPQLNPSTEHPFLWKSMSCGSNGSNSVEYKTKCNKLGKRLQRGFFM